MAAINNTVWGNPRSFFKKHCRKGRVLHVLGGRWVDLVVVIVIAIIIVIDDDKCCRLLGVDI